MFVAQTLVSFRGIDRLIHPTPSLQVQFLWPHPKGPLPDRDTKPAAELEALFNPPLPPDNAASSPGPPDTFCLLLLRPLRVDHLELKASPQRRTLHSWGGKEGGRWRTEAVNP